ncbi:MAG: PAS domain-containing protein, partial [Planctomycetota bacterium]
IEARWIQRYCDVAITQKPINFEDYNHNTNKHYDVFAFPVTKEKFSMLFFNYMLKQMTGFKQSELTTGELCSIEPHILAQDRDRVAAMVKNACDEKEPFEVEYRFECKNGDIKWFKEIGRPTFGPDDELLFIDGIITDITDRKQAEDALQDREEKWRSLAETAPVTIMNVSRDGTIKFINRVLEQHTLEQVIGTRVYDYIPQDQHDRVRKFFERAFETGKPDSLEILAVGPEGPETAWYENHIGPIFDQNGKVANVTMVAIDITDRKRAEKELRDESAFREAVIERAAEGICVCHAVEEHPYVEFTVWNERMGEITGYTMDEINRLGWYQTVYPDSEVRERAIERMEHMRQGDDLVAEEWEITRKDGLKRLLAISTSVIVTEGNKIHVLALMHDITEEKKLQAKRESLLKSQ